MNNKKTGKQGEDLAAEFLIKKDYEILERNYMCAVGEVDIIARKGNELIFIEVKTRRQETYGAPRDSVNEIKTKHMYSVAELYVQEKEISDMYISFDVVEVYICYERIIIGHIQNAIIENPRKVFK